jgi:hypothetical protein
MADASGPPEAAPRTIALDLSARTVAVRIAIVSALVSIAGLGAELGHAAFGWPTEHGVVPTLSLSYEANVPTFWSAALLAACSVALAVAASAASATRAKHVWGWWLLAAGFLYMSLDESIEIHEHMAWLATSGVLTFSWIVPGAALVLVIGISYIRFLVDLEPRTRWLFMAAGAIYVGGAIGFELPLGWWVSRYGQDGLGYGLIDWAEESLEIAGASLFLYALLRHLARSRVTLRFAERSVRKTKEIAA